MLPGMQSAFVDIGLERDAFLYVSDFFEDNDEYDKIVTSVEEKVLKLDRPGSAAAPAASAAAASRRRLEATPARSGGNSGGRSRRPPACTPPPAAAPAGAREAAATTADGDDRRGGGARAGAAAVRRKGGGRGLPESKFYSPRPDAASPVCRRTGCRPRSKWSAAIRRPAESPTTSSCCRANRWRSTRRTRRRQRTGRRSGRGQASRRNRRPKSNRRSKPERRSRRRFGACEPEPVAERSMLTEVRGDCACRARVPEPAVEEPAAGRAGGRPARRRKARRRSRAARGTPCRGIWPRRSGAGSRRERRAG